MRVIALSLFFLWKLGRFLIQWCTVVFWLTLNLVFSVKFGSFEVWEFTSVRCYLNKWVAFMIYIHSSSTRSHQCLSNILGYGTANSWARIEDYIYKVKSQKTVSGSKLPPHIMSPFTIVAHVVRSANKLALKHDWTFHWTLLIMSLITWEPQTVVTWSMRFQEHESFPKDSTDIWVPYVKLPFWHSYNVRVMYCDFSRYYGTYMWGWVLWIFVCSGGWRYRDLLESQTSCPSVRPCTPVVLGLSR